MRVITAADIHGDRIDELTTWLPAALRGEVRIDPSAYVRFSYDLKGGASDNWDEVFIACELINLLYGYVTVYSEGEIIGWIRNKLLDRRFMQKEFGAWVYLRHHVEPTIAQLAVCRHLSTLRSDPWTELAAGLDEWLRALCGWVTVTGCWGQGQDWGKGPHEGPGARLLTGRGGPNPRHGGARYSVLAGKRSWHYDTKDREWTRNLSAPIYLSRLALRERRTGGDMLPVEILEAVKAKFGYDLDVLTPRESELVAAAITNDISALKWAVRELIRDWLPAERNVVVRTERGVGQMMLAAGKSPTASVYYSDWLSDGTTHAAGCDPGLRGAHGEQIEPGMVSYDIGNRAGYCVRTDGDPRPIVQFPLPPGPLVAVLEFGGGAPTVERYFVNGVEQPSAPPPAPPAPPVPDEERERPDRNRGCMLFSRLKRRK